MNEFTIVIPAKNEATGLLPLLTDVRKLYPEVQVIVVDDGSTDDTAELSERFSAKVIRHPYSKGNGAAVKSGLRAVKTKWVVCMDADGQHQAKDIEPLLEKLKSGHDMVVGARDRNSQAGVLRAFGNGVYNRLASWMVGQPILDLTSGFRAADTEKMKQFLNLFPNGFSYPTTVTMAFFRSGFSVDYHPIIAPPRIGKSHLSVWKDGIRFLLIIFKIGTLYSPLKLFTPVSALFFGLGLFHYVNTYLNDGRFTNMSALLFVSSVLIFFMGLISEQITTLVYTINADQNKVKKSE